ncbi:hypothetical protein KDD30_07200 [Photobacterium sp. GJ3]|uniref:hypothetical protein n=1 Tax=Photobacterium sp. GJ3 TaxID=2829502 RepID=UPI001B8BED73|nr:hypothetical protein [Photobacterium sp. GJ3]QUJ68862.1 hypothetical protein KDD30_07200 [Photobacterium sp. GJ3]
MSKIVNQDASKAIKGILYQFYEAVHWCWQLTKGQSLYIEKFGDISISDQSNIEVKNYGDSLTDSHDNFWKTLSNWLNDSFDDSNYKYLILLTTQPIGDRSKFIRWNESNLDEKIEVLKKISESAEQRYELSLQKYSSNTTGKKNKPSPPKYIRSVIDNIDTQKIQNVLEKFIILDSSPIFTERYNQLLDIYGKSVLEKNRETFINAQLGFILTPMVVEGNGWKISYQDFTTEVGVLTQKLQSNSRVFPSKPDLETIENESNLDDRLFIKKIIDINYSDEIKEAYDDYISSSLIIAEEFKFGTLQKYLNEFQDSVISDFKRQFKRSSRGCSSDVIRDSQDFYDDCMLLARHHSPDMNQPRKVLGMVYCI